jgi:poly-gamma-glutamate synthesis protein (capsule biosynthesis protein)
MLLRGLGSCLLVAVSLWSSVSVVANDNGSDTVKLIFVGDIMIAEDEETGKLIEQGVDPFEPFASLLKEADVAVGNLECVVTEGGEKVDKKYNFRAHPRCLPLLKQHFTALSVANNHSGDFGKAAFAQQCELLERAGIPYFGGGRNKAAAHKPWIVERNGIRIALLGYCEVYLKSFQAEESVPGIAWSEHDDEVLTDIRAAREKYKADLVIPFMHWGDENEPTTVREKKFARQMIDAGADAIVGTHPHVVQDVEYYKKDLIVYSLGNFLFSGFTHPDNLNGWVLRMTVDKRGVTAWDIVVLKLDEHGVPQPDLKAKSASGSRADEEIVMKSIGESG